REALATRRIALPPPDPARDAVLARYVDAWERSDSAALVALLRDEAVLAMPPIGEWLQGRAAIGVSIEAMVFATAPAGAFRCIAIEASGQPGFAVYARTPAGEYRAFAVHVLELAGGAIASITAFLSPSLVEKFGLAPALA